MRRAILLAALGLVTVVQASDTDDLLSALKRARTLEARGQVQVTVNFPPRPDAVRQVGRLPALPYRPVLLTRNFDVTRGTTRPLAGRTVTRFDLTPRVGPASRWTFWIDTVWAIPLAFEERRADGALARQATFLKINAKPVQRSADPPPPIPAGLRPALQQALPGLRLPPGFVPVRVKQVNRRLEITLEDGVNTLLLVTAPRNVQSAAGVASRRVGNRFVWLVGNLPQAVLTGALAQVSQIDDAALGTFVQAADSNTGLR